MMVKKNKMSRTQSIEKIRKLKINKFHQPNEGKTSIRKIH